MVTDSECAVQIVVLRVKLHAVEVVADAGTHDITKTSIEAEIQIGHVAIVLIEIECEYIDVRPQPPLVANNNRAKYAQRGQRYVHLQSLGLLCVVRPKAGLELRIR